MDYTTLKQMSNVQGESFIKVEKLLMHLLYRDQSRTPEIIIAELQEKKDDMAVDDYTECILDLFSACARDGFPPSLLFDSIATKIDRICNGEG